MLYILNIHNFYLKYKEIWGKAYSWRCLLRSHILKSFFPSYLFSLIQKGENQLTPSSKMVFNLDCLLESPRKLCKYWCLCSIPTNLDLIFGGCAVGNGIFKSFPCNSIMYSQGGKPLVHWFWKSGFQISSRGITCKLIKNSSSQIQPTSIKSKARRGPTQWCTNKPSSSYWCMLW